MRELRILSDCVSAATADSVTQFVAHQQGLLRASQERLQAILDNAPAAVYVKDLEGRWLIANRRMEVMFGRPASALVGKRDEEVLTAEAARVTRANDARVLAANGPLESEEVVPLADGPHTYLSLKFPLCDARGRATAVCGIALRYSPPESPVRVRLQAEGRDAVALHVHNAGPPIPVEARASLFLPFHRGAGADGTTFSVRLPRHPPGTR